MSKLVERLELKQESASCPDKRYIDYMCPELVVDEIFEAFIKGQSEPLNICISEIEEIDGDYLIRGFDEEDNEVELKLSEVQFWIS